MVAPLPGRSEGKPGPAAAKGDVPGPALARYQGGDDHVLDLLDAPRGHVRLQTTSMNRLRPANIAVGAGCVSSPAGLRPVLTPVPAWPVLGDYWPTLTPGMPNGYSIGFAGALPGTLARVEYLPSGRTVRPQDAAIIIALAV